MCTFNWNLTFTSHIPSARTHLCRCRWYEFLPKQIYKWTLPLFLCWVENKLWNTGFCIPDPAFQLLLGRFWGDPAAPRCLLVTTWDVARNHLQELVHRPFPSQAANHHQTLPRREEEMLSLPNSFHRRPLKDFTSGAWERQGSFISMLQLGLSLPWDFPFQGNQGLWGWPCQRQASPRCSMN